MTDPFNGHARSVQLVSLPNDQSVQLSSPYLLTSRVDCEQVYHILKSGGLYVIVKDKYINIPKFKQHPNKLNSCNNWFKA